MIKYIKWLINLPKEIENLRQRIAYLDSRVDEMSGMLKATTDAYVDVHAPNTPSPNIVILLGRRNGRDYLNMYQCAEKEFDSFSRELHCLRRNSTIQCIDAPPSIRGFFDVDI